MKKPTFVSSNELVKFEETDLELELEKIGLKILNWGVIDRNSCFHIFTKEVNRNELISLIKKNLLDRDSSDLFKITWSNMDTYSIICDSDYLIKNINSIIDEDWDFWIISVNNKKVLEYYHEGELSFYLID
ncbi:hypothetical protein [Acinetobacter lanii]|uniref:Uncharacterized protein n=1 Tax=Acinetobacter lanii TaxID=2715163 RepID=A0A6G8S4N7_9GAMM|nr:hypothetical protein [Acinetobacter lanii]QIO08933.1 hypothetical protein G8D99_07850 [Acinetobacter lanii]